MKKFACLLMFAFWLFSAPFLEAMDRRSSAPYISGDTFRAYCRFKYDETTRDLDPSAVNDGDTIFVKTDYVDEFFIQIHPFIDACYIIVSHNSDYHVTKNFETYLDDNKVIAWFGQNVESDHPRIHHIPIGLANRYWGHGNIAFIDEVQQQLPKIEKNILLYMNFTVGNYWAERSLVAALFQNEPYCHVAAMRDYRSYLRELAQSEFVLSPRGNGMDCHRTWEALLMGAIPIVKTSSLDPLYDKLPVLIVDDWHEVNEDFLNAKYDEMQAQAYDMERAYSAYWLDLIQSYTKK